MADVLVVDDDDDLTEIVAMVIEAEGHHVRVAHDGQEGLAMVHAKLPDIALLDVEMPHLTGPEMAYQMLMHDLGEELVPIVLVSGVVDLQEIARRVGTPYFVAKPCSIESLGAVVRRALGGRRAPHPQPPAA